MVQILTVKKFAILILYFFFSLSLPVCVCTYFFIAKECIKKWRGLRVSYVREKKREKERTRSGAGRVNHKPWKYYAVMGFLAPFVEQRATSGNFPAAGPGGKPGCGHEPSRNRG